MSSAPKSEALKIPSRAKSVIPDDVLVSPGGTMFTHTPGGTKVVYDKNTMMLMRNSPLSKTPPVGLPNIPGVTGPSPVATSPLSVAADGSVPTTANSVKLINSTSPTSATESVKSPDSTASATSAPAAAKDEADEGEMFDMDE